MQITLITNNNQNIVLELLDNVFTREFITQLKLVKSSCQQKSWQERIPYDRKKWDPTEVEKNQQLILNSISTLNSLGLNFPIPIETIVFDATSNTSRQLLNRLHRCFTTGHASRTIWEYNTNNTFSLNPDDYPEFSRAVHDINTAVHNIEGFATNDRIEKFEKYYEYQINFSSDNLSPTDYYKSIKFEHKQYFTDRLEYDVWLPVYQIQGKNYWAAYFDYDSPDHWDISTNVVYSGSMALGDRSIIQRPEIQNWFREYNIVPGPLHYGMPLGNIISGKEIISTLPDVNGIVDLIIND